LTEKLGREITSVDVKCGAQSSWWKLETMLIIPTFNFIKALLLSLLVVSQLLAGVTFDHQPSSTRLR